MSFLAWYGIGIATLFITFAQQLIRDNGVGHAAKEMYDIFIRKADPLSTSLILLLALGGPLLIVAITYFVIRNWIDGLAIDEDGNRDYPWSKE